MKRLTCKHLLLGGLLAGLVMNTVDAQAVHGSISPTPPADCGGGFWSVHYGDAYKTLREAEDYTPGARTYYVRELNEAYNHFFFHYNATPLLVVETSQFDLTWGDEALDDLLKQLNGMGRGTRYYVPRTR